MTELARTPAGARPVARAARGGTTETVLLTGATGFLGLEVLARLLAGDDRRVLALVRADDERDAARRLTEAMRGFDPRLLDRAARVRAVHGDVTQDRLGLSDADHARVLREVTSVVHCAASVSFSLPVEAARGVNVVGAARVLALARGLADRGRLRRIVHVSTAYVAGRHQGVFAESDLDIGQAFRNSYERSKYEAEALIATEFADLPLVVARPSIIVGESDTGWTPVFNVLYQPLRAFARGLLDVLPAPADGRVDVVPVDFVADALVHLLDDDGVRGVVHLVSGDDAIGTPELAELAAAQLNRAPPRLAPAARLGPPISGGYLPYFDMRVRFDDVRGRAALAPAGIAVRPLVDYLPRLVAYAQLAGWGRRPLPRHAALAATV